MRYFIPFMIVLSLWSFNLGAQGATEASLTVRSSRAEQIANWPNLIKDSLVTPRWLARGEQLVFWAANGPNAGTWVLVDASTGKKSPLIDPQLLRTQLSAINKTAVNMSPQMPFEMTTDDDNLLFQFAGHSYRLNLTSKRVERDVYRSDSIGQLFRHRPSGSLSR